MRTYEYASDLCGVVISGMVLKLLRFNKPESHEIVPACGSDIERALGALLALDVAEVDARGFGFAHPRLRPCQHLRAAEMIGELDEGIRAHDAHLGAGPGGFRPAGGRAYQPFTARIGAD